MASKDYGQMLRDPLWQRRRLEIFERDGFACTECKERHGELQVHHRYYAKDRAPWEYESGSLVTLCDACHERAESLRLLFQQTAGLLSLGKTTRVIGYAEGLVARDAIQGDMKILFRGVEHLAGFCDAMGIDPLEAAACFSKDGVASLQALQGTTARGKAA